MPPPRLLCRRGSGITSPLSGEQNFYFVEFAGFFSAAPRPRFALVRHGRLLSAGQPPACRRTPQSLGGAYRSQLRRGFPPTAAAPRVTRHSRGALPHGRASVDSTGQ